MTLRSLAHILHLSQPQQVVAWRHNTRYCAADFLHTISALHNTLLARTEQRWLLAHGDSYNFAICLCALLAAGKQVVLPPNTQAGTIAALQHHFDAQLCNIDVDTITQESCLSNDNPLSKHTLDLDALTITLLTSGSTGEPKAIRKTLRCLDNEIQALEQLWGDKLGNAAVLATVSHQHIYGLLFRLLWPLCAGRAFAAHTHSYPEPLVAELQQQSRSVLIASPAQLKRFSPAIDLTALSDTLLAVYSSGGPLPSAAAVHWLQHWGQAPIEVLGSTETGGIAWRQIPAVDASSDDVLWQTLPGVIASIDAEHVLCVQSPFIDAALLQTRQTCTTGDRIALINPQQFRLLGRTDRIVKIEEKRLSLTQMEQQLCASTLVEEARVLPLPQSPGRLGAVVSLTSAGYTLLNHQGKQAVTQLLREHLNQHFERVLLPRKWRFIEHWPTDTQGKISHTALANLFNPSQEPQLLSSTATERVLRIALPLQSPLFAGHFPDLPILPGVVQFDLAVRQCSAWYPLTAFCGIEKLKFQEPVIPGDTITLHLENKGNGQVHFRYTLEEQALSSGRIVFTV